MTPFIDILTVGENELFLKIATLNCDVWDTLIKDSTHVPTGRCRVHLH